MNRVLNKVVLITGGAQGIGEASARLLAKEGARVVVLDLLDKEGEQLVQSIKEKGGDAAYWHLDVTDEANIKKTFKAITDKWNKIDVLVNNAGISGANAPTDEISEEEWDAVMNVNVKGVFLCTKHAIPYMKKNGSGSIINLSSIYGLVGAPDAPPYHAAKGAVRLMSKTDAMLYAADGIRVNSVHPGYIWTSMVENHLKKQGISLEQGRKDLAALHPIGHVGEPEDIAYGILYLASDESKIVTGSELIIDGGYTAH